ncbi:MAG: phosphopantetheine-binding protein [Thermoanaerobaculia bacterium]
MSARERLAGFVLGRLREFEREPEGELTDDTPLLESGLLDSLGLLHLAVWIEGEIGSPLDVTAVDLRKEWNTVADILRFIERRRGA